MLPPLRINSDEHPITPENFLFEIFTPITFLFEMIIFSTKVFVKISKFGRFDIGFKNASAALNLFPFLIFT